MRKGKVILSTVMVMAMLLATGCQESQKRTNATSKATNVNVTTETTTAEEDEQVETTQAVSEAEGEEGSDSSGTGAGRIYTNDYGFTVTYNDTVFEMLADEGCNTLQLINQDVTKEIPVYIAFQVIENSTVEDVAEGVRGQSEIVSDTTDVKVGSGQYDAKSFTQTMSLDIGEQSVVFYLIQYDSEVIMIEKGCATEESTQNAENLQQILDSFTLE